VSWHLPVDRWVHPDEFARFKAFGEDELGFAWVESGPLVRSSYHAGKQYRSASAKLKEIA
jgi:lipoic acid synthetase